jgi:predicted nucleic acid-binding protein
VRIVIDASIALKWVISETSSDLADALLDQDLIAPVLWLTVAANALWRRTRIGDITAEQAIVRLSDLRKAPVTSLAMDPHLDQALKLTTEIGHPIYDCLYLAVALHHDTHVVTADRRFASAANISGLMDRVRLLAN